MSASNGPDIPALFVAPVIQPRNPSGREDTRLEPTRPDTRHRIVDAAERLYRQFGQHKTTVADIAHALSMSSANVYRFFHSKDAISEAVCGRLVDDLISVATDIARRNDLAADRLRVLLVALARLNIERFRTDKPLNDLFVLATSEHWPIATSYVERMESILAVIVTDGMRRGEFRDGDPRQAARRVHAAMMLYLHPALIVENDGTDQPTLDDMVEFCVAGLR